ncbi:hypothetical protein K502DRAFT_327421 [Neoconidiobolus thromboides FSU 785]|nr:hypothetical protein K502DRAFT_327421 [Neoconidiobolus thromboides FSU 785]
MTDLTKEYKELTTNYKKEIKVEKKKHETNLKSDNFINEAYRILKDLTELNVQLIEVKPSYLNLVRKYSSSLTKINPMSDKERDELDAYIKISLNKTGTLILNLAEKDQERKRDFEKKVIKKDKSLLSRWLPEEWLNTSGSKNKIVDIIGDHRESIIWYLNSCVKEVTESFKNLQHIRLSRELERQETFSFKTNSMNKQSDTFNLPWGKKQKEPKLPPPIRSVEEEKLPTLELDQAQLQVLEKENSALLEQFESTLKEVELAEKSLQEISSMQTTLATHIEIQAKEAEKLYQDANITQDNLDRGNTSLLSATSNSQQSRRFMLWFFIISSSTLLFLDWYKKF